MPRLILSVSLVLHFGQRYDLRSTLMLSGFSFVVVIVDR